MSFQRNSTTGSNVSKKLFYVEAEYSTKLHISADQLPFDHIYYGTDILVLCNRVEGEVFPALDISIKTLPECKTCIRALQVIDEDRYSRSKYRERRRVIRTCQRVHKDNSGNRVTCDRPARIVHVGSSRDFIWMCYWCEKEFNARRK